NRSIIHTRYNKTPYELINVRKSNISFLYVFGDLCYLYNDREDRRKLKAKGDIGFFIGYFGYGLGFKIYNRKTKKVMETVNVKFDKFWAMASKQLSLDPALQQMASTTLNLELGLQQKTSRQISSRLVHNKVPSTITPDKPSKSDLDHLYETMYDDYLRNQPNAHQIAPSTATAAPLPQNVNTPSTSTTVELQAPTPTNLFGRLVDSDGPVPNNLFQTHITNFFRENVVHAGWLNLEAWNSFPWGELLWCHFYDEIKNLKERHGDEHYYGLKKDRNYVRTYTLSGFVFAFQKHDSDEDIAQVFIPINETGEHWCLAQFHILSGVVTFYDTRETYDHDYRDWNPHIDVMLWWCYLLLSIKAEDNVEPEVILGRSFMRLAKGIVDFSNGVITIYLEPDPFKDDSVKTEKIPNDWDQLLDFNFDDIPKFGGEQPPLVYKVELNGKIVKEEEEAVKRIKGEALKEKDDPGAFIFPIRLEGKVKENALADTGFDVLRTIDCDSDDEEEYQIERNKFGASINGPKPAPYLNCNDPTNQSLALQAVTNPFWKISVWKKAFSFLGGSNRTMAYEDKVDGSIQKYLSTRVHNKENGPEVVKDVYGGGCFDVDGSFKGFDSIDERVGYNDISLPGKSEDEFSNKSEMNHQTSSVPQIAYQSPQVSTQPITKSPLVDSGFTVPVFFPGDDPIACLNKSNATSSGENNASEQTRVVKCYNCQGEGHMARKCTQPKRSRNAAWYKDKAMFTEAQEAGQILDEEQFAFLADPGVLNAVLMANISSYGSYVILDVPHSETYLNDMENQKTLILEEASRSKMAEKDKHPKAVKRKISNKPLDYVKLNKIYEDFGKRFVPQQELSANEAVCLLNESLKELKLHLANFEKVVKIRTRPNARTESEWGFEHTKAVFNNEFILFLKSLKDIFNVFDKDLLNEIMEGQTVFNQMDAAVQQSSVDKQRLEISKIELLMEIDQLLHQIMSQDVLLTVMNSMSLIDESVNVERKRNESCDKCFNLEAELLKSQNAHNYLLK
nr:putative RNA-directed DNA polymerase [Tanacetum cinerariifolium]